MKNKNKNIVIIGAGVVGCAIAFRLSSEGHNIFVLEKNARIADGVTSRNSGVIHAGIYYPPESLKAQSCIAGNKKLYDWCQRKNVTFKKTGKWIVGDSSKKEDLLAIYENAIKSGAIGIRQANEVEIRQLNEIGVEAEIALFSELSGVVDPYEYSKSFRVEAEKNGAEFILNTEVISIQKKISLIIETTKGDMEADLLVNCAGLYSDEIHKMLGYNDIRIYPYRGDYFRIKKDLEIPFLVYPMKAKNDPGLGVHLTLDLNGSCRLGPDVTIIDSKEDFAEPVNIEKKKELFYQAGKKILKNLKMEDLEYDTCGIRPKLRAPEDKSEKDFLLRKYEENYIALIGIESPGITAAIDLADRVSNLLDCS